MGAGGGGSGSVRRPHWQTSNGKALGKSESLVSPNIGEVVPFLGGMGPTKGQKHHACLAVDCSRIGVSKSHAEGKPARA